MLGKKLSLNIKTNMILLILQVILNISGKVELLEELSEAEGLNMLMVQTTIGQFMKNTEFSHDILLSSSTHSFLCKFLTSSIVKNFMNK